MFGHLYNEVFPYVIEFFSKLVGLSTMSIGDLITSVNTNCVIPYVNLLTGVSSTYVLYGAWGPAQPIVAGIVAIVFGTTPINYPLWLAMLLCCIEVYFVIAIIKFVGDLIL